ncbi:MAG: hypothetical protein QOH63_169 [Acidobacteriota bacterium]|jgi:hypothetical protein|nr:hypothetical protein [Acidobacteriota bacterium]
MNFSLLKKSGALLALLVLFMLAVETRSAAPMPPLPNPMLYLTGQEQYQAGGKQWVRYKYAVDNFDAYPNEMFAPAPELPPCGANAKSSRTWVDFYDQRGKRLYGFCALTSHNGLNEIWFALETDVIPPSYVYIEMNDRKTNTKYKSNLADTTP